MPVACYYFHYHIPITCTNQNIILLGKLMPSKIAISHYQAAIKYKVAYYFFLAFIAALAIQYPYEA
ncbi:hypothetical protein G114_13408 [Aeromonas diversa CDC 2478-85]|uniref:Uncharacterized protein n=1 Tax=Aeromonas diversa CDC 2478-85 TaxID=1268237 RepID=N9VIB3_9GAMM|nr:hypothetical protein G114_13408 [Aeromonas diversa CDC 2478-85]